MNEELEYDALLIDTSIFDGNGLRLEKGLLGKLSQFKKSPVDFLMPDVICNEVKAHLEKKIKESRSALEKSINDAGDHLFFDGSTLNDAKSILLGGTQVEGLAKTRLNNFLINTGALVIECGEHLNISDLLKQYFENKPPFSTSGKKKNEFPDAIILMAAEEWADKNNKSILAIAEDKDWSRYCESSKHICCIDDLSDGLAIFNKETAPYAFLSNLEAALDNETGKPFLDRIEERLTCLLDDFTPDQDVESEFYWEPEGCNGWFKSFYLTGHEFKIIENDKDFIVLEGHAAITVEAEGEFSLSVYDSIDKDYVCLTSILKSAEEEFESAILITITGDINGPIEKLTISDVEIVDLIQSIDFGFLELNLGFYE